MAGESFFHVGLIVPELEPALAQLGDLLGLTWLDPFDGEVGMHLADGGEQTLHLRFAYSREEPRLEVIEGIPGTPWAYDERGSNLHHLGFYADDLSAESERVASTWCPMEACAVGPEGVRPASFAYHAKGGLRIELVDAALRSLMFPA